MILKELYLLGNVFCSALCVFRYTQGQYLLVLKLFIYSGLKFPEKHTDGLRGGESFFKKGFPAAQGIMCMLQTLPVPDVQRWKVKTGRGEKKLTKNPGWSQYSIKEH